MYVLIVYYFYRALPDCPTIPGNPTLLLSPFHPGVPVTADNPMPPLSPFGPCGPVSPSSPFSPDVPGNPSVYDAQTVSFFHNH
jgi:hypothetical protein